MNWDSDCDTEDMGLDYPGVVAFLTCSNCRATAEYFTPPEEEKCQEE